MVKKIKENNYKENKGEKIISKWTLKNFVQVSEAEEGRPVVSPLASNKPIGTYEDYVRQKIT